MQTLNLDCLDRTELLQVAEYAADKRLATYAVKKATAMEYRAKGEISKAHRIETECDEIYNRLPESLRW